MSKKLILVLTVVVTFIVVLTGCTPSSPDKKDYDGVFMEKSQYTEYMSAREKYPEDYKGIDLTYKEIKEGLSAYKKAKVNTNNYGETGTQILAGAVLTYKNNSIVLAYDGATVWDITDAKSSGKRLSGEELEAWFSQLYDLFYLEDYDE